MGTEPWDCGPWQRSRWGASDRRGHCRVLSEVTEPVALRYEGGLRCTPRRLFCTWWALRSSAGIPESGQPPTSCLTEPAPCHHLWWRLMTQHGPSNRISDQKDIMAPGYKVLASNERDRQQLGFSEGSLCAGPSVSCAGALGSRAHL